MKKQIIISLLAIFSSLLFAEIHNTNEFSASLAVYDIDSSQKYHTKLNLKPELTIDIYDNDNWYIDSDLIWNGFYNRYTNDENTIEKNDIKLYRGWLRLAGPQSELRVGKQKLNFGPALLLRSLRWFDKIDPRDPQQNTTGVDAALFRYFFLNNSSLWFWLIRSEDELKGNEFLSSEEDGLEYGTRIEYPFEFCETGLTFHMRQLDLSQEAEIKESRLGIDARWDSYIGYWLEASLGVFDDHYLIPKYEKNLTLGADYTIAWKNGVYCLIEHAIYSFSKDEITSSYQEDHVSAVHLEYPISLFSSIKLIAFYTWDTEDLVGSMIYKRSYNYLDLYFSMNFNPYIDPPDPEKVSYDGYSLQLKAIYNFEIF